MLQITIAKYEHIDTIRELNKKHLIGHLTELQKQNGFIRIEYRETDLQKIIDNQEIVIASDKGKVIGYYLIGRKAGIAVLDYQKHKSLSLASISFETIGYGCQVCIDEIYRKNGLFQQMLNGFS